MIGYIFARCDYDPARDIPDLTGKVAIVTGANSGIGLCTSEQLALHGAKVHMACRSEKRARAAIAGIEDRTPPLKGRNKLVWLPLDLSSVASSKAAAQAFLERENRLDILVNNAGRMASDYVLSSEGLELSVAVNHLGHFVFTNTLLPLMKETSKSKDSDVRIINVSSSAYMRPGNTNFNSMKELNDPQSGPEKENAWGTSFKRYGKSKLMNHLFTAELQRRINADLEDTPIIVLTVHPGGVDSEGARQLAFPLYIKLFMKAFAMTPLQGAFTSLFAATSPQIAAERKKYEGRYIVPYGKIATGTQAARDPSLARTLWETSERVSGDILAQERQ
ncbi:NAD-P-binding protein [Dentipellis sp. KUC8613]|nr:NAD-P-binding protein [Dentipellis sp. KUC8613]